MKDETFKSQGKEMINGYLNSKKNNNFKKEDYTILGYSTIVALNKEGQELINKLKDKLK